MVERPIARSLFLELLEPLTISSVEFILETLTSSENQELALKGTRF